MNEDTIIKWAVVIIAGLACLYGSLTVLVIIWWHDRKRRLRDKMLGRNNRLEGSKTLPADVVRCAGADLPECEMRIPSDATQQQAPQAIPATRRQPDGPSGGHPGRSPAVAGRPHSLGDGA